MIRQLNGLLFITSIIGVFLINSCSSKPMRPQNVPSSAVWASGPEFGYYFECTLEQPTNLYNCTVYNDHTGAILAKGHYRAKGPIKLVDPVKFQYWDFDGTKIYLKDGTVLEPIEKAKPPSQ